MNLMDIVLIVGGVGYVLVRRMMGELLEIKRLLIIPVVLTVIGASSLRAVHHPGAAGVAFIAIGIAISVALGLARGMTVHLGNRDGHLWMRYTAGSVGLWIANLALKGLLVPVERGVSHTAATASNHALMLSIGLGILAETAVVLLRAMQSDATVVWAKGEDGAPHRTSPAFEQARSWVATDGDGVDLRKKVRLPTRDW